MDDKAPATANAPELLHSLPRSKHLDQAVRICKCPPKHDDLPTGTQFQRGCHRFSNRTASHVAIFGGLLLSLIFGKSAVRLAAGLTVALSTDAHFVDFGQPARLWAMLKDHRQVGG